MADRFIDFDHASTTQMRKEVLDAMLPYFMEYYGNAGSRHELGVASNRAYNQARKQIASLLNTNNESIYFTSGATEANNWAIRGTAMGYMSKGKHLIVSSTEHPSVLNCCKQLEKEGFEVTYLPVDEKGRVDLLKLKNAIRTDTTLMSVMYANNETGSIQPIEEIGKLCREHQILFHTDAVQAFGKVPISLKDSGIDLLTISGHKIYGPKGIGCLYIRDYLKVLPVLFGGEQQNGFRPGTEPVPQIVGMAKACELMLTDLEQETERLEEVREYLKSSLCKNFENIVLNEDENHHLSNILNVSFVGEEAEQIMAYLDIKHIYVSGGSACTSSNRKPSHVLTAMGKKQNEIKGAIRFSLGRENTKEDCDAVIHALLERKKKYT